MQLAVQNRDDAELVKLADHPSLAEYPLPDTDSSGVLLQICPEERLDRLADRKAGS